MALRNILTKEQPTLYKKCRPVTEFNPRLHQLLDDMRETLMDANGVGLAAPQVGVLKRIVVMDVEDGNQYVLINPVIEETDGEQVGDEGCLSVPGKTGTVTRPEHVIVRALDENMEEFRLEGTDLLARCICHECDHLDGVLYVDKVEGGLRDVEAGEDEEEA